MHPVANAINRGLGGKGSPPAFQCGQLSHHLAQRNGTVSSDKAFALPVRLEEAKPQVRDQRIELTPSYDPKPAEDKDNVLVWTFELPAKGKKTVTWGVELKAPADMPLDLGWR